MIVDLNSTDISLEVEFLGNNAVLQPVIYFHYPLMPFLE